MPLFYLNAAFTIWMLVDAGRRRIDSYWYLIILMPLGAWIYFFAVKIHDFDFKGARKRLLDGPPSLADLEQTAEATPSLDNKLRWAQGLYDKGQFERAQTLFEEILRQDDGEKDALYGDGLCKVELKQFRDASRRFVKLIEVDAPYADYEPWFDLAFAQWQDGNKSDAVDVLEKLVETSPRMKHKVILGKYLARSGKTDRARTMLEGAMSDYQEATPFVRRTSGRWLNEARKTLGQL